MRLDPSQPLLRCVALVGPASSALFAFISPSEKWDTGQTRSTVAVGVTPGLCVIHVGDNQALFLKPCPQGFPSADSAHTPFTLDFT